MSEQAPETPAGRGSTPSSGSNVFTRRIGPLPMWQWLLIALGMLSVYVIFAYRKKNKGATAAGSPTGGTTGEAQVPQFVNQTNTYVSPPSAPTMPPSAHPIPARQPVQTAPMVPRSISLSGWIPGAPESAQAWNADINNIAAHYGVSVASVIAANPQIPDPNRIAPGTRINLPQGALGGPTLGQGG